MSENITASFLDQARKLNDQRLTAVQEIAAAVQARVDAEHALSHAQAAERKAFKDAERKGWTKTELDRLRPTKRRRTNHPTGQATKQTADQTAGQAHVAVEAGEADHDPAPSTP